MTFRPTAVGRVRGPDSWPFSGSSPARCSRCKSLPERFRIGCSMLASSLAVCIVVYSVGVVRLWRSAGYGRGIRPLEVLAFATGWLALVIALSPPLDEWSEQWLAAHMVQHELLMVVAAPLVAFGAPLVGILWAVPSRVRPTLVTTVQRTTLP